MPLFPLGILFLLIYQYRHTREAGWLLAVPLFGVIAKALEYIPVANLDGYADMPVAFLALLTVLFYANRGCPPSRIHAVLALAFALTAALTKQAGLYIFGLLALALAVEAVMRKDPAYRRTVIVALLAATGVLATWYIPVEYRIRLGLDSSEVPWVTHGIYGNVSLLQRVARAPQFLIEHSYVLFLFFVLGVFHPQSRRWAVSIAIPYTVLWAGFWAYDARNLTLAMPFFAISAAFGVMMLDQWARRYVSNGWIAAIITLAILIAYVFRDPSVVHLGGYASLGPDGSSPHWVQARMQMVVLFSCLAAIALILAFRIPVWASLGIALITAVVLGLGPFSASTLHRHVEKDRPIMFSFEEHLQDRPLGSVTAPATGHTNGPSAPP